MRRIANVLAAGALLPGLLVAGPAAADSLVATDQTVMATGGGGPAQSTIVQSGSYNIGIVDQSGGNVSLYQSGSSNYANINTVGANVMANQTGGASVTVTGNGPSVIITQGRAR